jgi:hypothetical protein
MTIDLTPATSLSTVAGYGLAPSRRILNSTADEAVTTVGSPLGELGRTANVLRAARAIW